MTEPGQGGADRHGPPPSWDVIVIGGGSAGCVMASRLSENPARRVALLEAGPAEMPPSWQAAVRNGNQPALAEGLNWKYRTGIKGDGRAATTGVFDYHAGRVLGGSSAVNATQALRGHPSDFDAWVRDCGPAWSWAEVLPYFRKLEDDPLGPSELHGRGGPMPIRREDEASLTPLHASFAQACTEHGFARTPNLNDPHLTGVGVIPKNVVDGLRISAARAYLEPVRDRRNLHVLGDTHVHQLLWDGDRCAGVQVQAQGRLQTLHADAVVVCAGVMGTPALLLRSGVGDPAALLGLGVPVQIALPGVGEGLMEHPVVGLWGTPREGLGLRGEPLRQTLLRCASGSSGEVDDLHLCLMTAFDVREAGPGTASILLSGLTVCFNRPVSRGRLWLTSADPHVPPRIANHCLGDARDVPPLMHGVRLAWELMRSAPLRSKFERLLAWSDALIASPSALEQAVRTFVRPAAHGCGTARMGRCPDKGAVVDETGRLFGACNVWVADASVLPHAPSAPPHLTCLMVAEKLADGVRVHV